MFAAVFAAVMRQVDHARIRSVVVTGLVVGLLAGLASALLHTFVGEPLLRDAIALEEAAAATSGQLVGATEPELISRSVQSGLGLFVAMGLSGAVFGLLFACAFWGLRSAQPQPFRRALWAGMILFGSITLAPWLKYPPNPPGVGDPESIGRRQGLYVSLIALSLAFAILGVALAGLLGRRDWPEHRRTAVVALATAVAFGVALALLPPAPDQVDAPATLIWRFRLASLAGSALLWGLLTTGFGLLACEGSRLRCAEVAQRSSAAEGAEHVEQHC